MLHRVLIYGHDSLLLKTREMLLLQAGFDVCLISATDRIHEILATDPFDLLILCHSVYSLEQSTILIQARNCQKSMPTLLLVGNHPSPSIPDNVAVFSTLDGPYDFLRTVCELTHESAPDFFYFNPPHPGKELCHD